MSSMIAMFVLFGVLAAVMLGLFTTLWVKDKNRSHEEAHDPERTQSDPDPSARRG